MVNALIPVLNPASVKDVIELGLYGWALSRFSGCWISLKCVHDTIESSSSIHVSPNLAQIIIPEDFKLPLSGLNVRSNDNFLEQERRLHDQKLPAVQAFARANKLDRIVMGDSQAHTGIITTGKSYLDVRRALLDLGIDERKACQLGLRVYKVSMPWPLEPEGVREFSQGLKQIIVVEEKRELIEDQLKSILYHRPYTPVIVGKRDEHGAQLFDASGRLESSEIAVKLSRRFESSQIDPALSDRITWIEDIYKSDLVGNPAILRTPYFCAGCPHNSSTIVPEGSRALAGIGCHFMAQWMDRSTSSFTQMGAEGAGWIGESAFSKDRHVFQNIGDGTYFHSGVLAIRAAIAANTNITFKLLYNDAVAMTGGQSVDDQLNVAQITRQVAAEGAKQIIVVTDEPRKYSSKSDWAPGVKIRSRQELTSVQEELREVPGTTVLIYDQTCAVEKRRRRQRGVMHTPNRRVWINEDICEGCGDCGVQSNCVALTPLETSFGRKRTIDQNACNMDYSCVDGFCPSFVSVIGSGLKNESKQEQLEPLLQSLLLEPDTSPINGSYSIVLTGVGGTGVVTVGALLGMAAHLAGKGCSVLDMTGLAQKGGPVTSYIILTEEPDSAVATRVADGTANLLLGCDLVTAATTSNLRKLQSSTLVVVNTHQIMTGDFTRAPNTVFPSDELLHFLARHISGKKIHALDASMMATLAFSDSIAANLVMLGYSYQLGGLPIPSQAIERAIELNGRSISMNLTAFRLGRVAAVRLDDVRNALGWGSRGEALKQDETLGQIIDRGETFLNDYQNRGLALRYRMLVDRAAMVERQIAGSKEELAKTIAVSYRKVLAYKDEYEVARLFCLKTFRTKLSRSFNSGYTLRFHLASPIFSKIDPTTQRPIKKEFGSWIIPIFRILAASRWVRGTRFDPFRNSVDRQLERRLIDSYEASIEKILGQLSAENLKFAVDIAALPLEVRGYGPVKAQSAQAAERKEHHLWEKFQASS